MPTPKKSSSTSRSTKTSSKGGGTAAAKKTAAKGSSKPKAPAKSAAPKSAPANGKAPAAKEDKAEKPAGGPPKDKNIVMKPPIVVKDLATKMGLKPFQLVHQLMEMNVFAALTQAIEEDVAVKVCEANGFKFEVEKREKGAGQVHAPEKVVEPPKPEPIKEEDLQTRPPVITFMGHVDHGKTSLLDAIRQSNVTEGEAGGITQHIGAYQIERNGQKITFLDTPGHEAFTAMRARGANATDIAVLVVAADDGVMPTTKEAISHVKAAGVQLMVAVNKCDLPAANPDKVKGQLQEHEVSVEDYGGDIISCDVSATKGTGLENLIENMLLQSEVLELKASYKGHARGVIIEGQSEVGRGNTATVLVQSGVLKVGDTMLVGPLYGRVKALINDRGERIKEAGPSMPVKVLGLDGAPVPGEEFTVMRNEKEARSVAEERASKERLGKLEKGSVVTLENLFARTAKDQKKVLKMVLKADVQGSLEAVKDSLLKIDSDKIEVDFVHAGIGPVTENDILLAKASDAIVVGFNTKTDGSAASASKREEVQIKLYSIIYELIDQVKDAMAGLLDPEEREAHLGKAVVKQVFKLSKFPVAGCLVESGRIERKARARVLRDKTPIYDGGIHTLKRFQDDASEVKAGLECGIRLGDFNDYEVNDVIECYTLEKVAQSL